MKDEITSFEEYSTSDFVDAIKRRDSEISAIRKELDEQCRVNGMGAERELKLKSQLEELMRYVKVLLEFASQYCGGPAFVKIQEFLARHEQRKP